MTNGETRLRLATGVIAVRGLFQGIYGALIFFLLLDSIPKALDKANMFMSPHLSLMLLSSSASLSSSQPDREAIIIFMFFFALSLILHFVLDMLVLVGVIKRSDELLKGAFGLWIFLAFFSTLGFLGYVFGGQGTEQGGSVMSVVFDYILFMAYGMMMHQYLQLLKERTGDEESRAPLLGASR